jgi:hypothetical protein
MQAGLIVAMYVRYNIDTRRLGIKLHSSRQTILFDVLLN